MTTLFKRPESVLVVVYTVALDVLLIRRTAPAGFWQSVTGSLEYGEQPIEAAQRELFEETGITVPVIDQQRSRVFRISSRWRRRYAPGVTDNLEHEFVVQLPEPCTVTLNSAEHDSYSWMPISDAMARVSSHSNRAALKEIYNIEA